MSDTVIGASLKLDSAQAETSVKSFKTQLKEANNELLSMSTKFGEASSEAVTAAKKVALLKDAISDAKGLSDAFNPDAKFKAFSNAISGVVGGFAGLQGAMALFGGQSKEVEEALLKVQAAMALSQGVNSVLEAKDAFIQLGAKIKDIGIFQKANALANQIAAGTMKLFGVAVETTSTSFKVLKGAIAATGIGLLVVAIGEAVSAFDKFTSSAKEAEEAQKQFNDSVKAGADVQLKTELAGLKRRTDIAVAEAKLRGDSEKEIFDIQQKGLKQQSAALGRHYEEIKDIDTKAAIDDIDANKSIQNQIILSDLQFQLAEKKRAEDAAKERKALSEKEFKDQQERRKQQAEERKTLRLYEIEQQKKAYEQELADAAMFAKMGQEQTEKENKLIADNEKTRLEAKQKLAALKLIDEPDSSEAKIEKLKADLDLEISTLEEGDIQKQVITRQFEEAKTQIEKDESDKRTATRQAEADAKLAIQNSELDVLGQFGNLLTQIAGKHKALAAAGVIVENAAAIGRIIVNTAAANAKSVAASPLTAGMPWVAINTISAGLGIAASLLATKNALSQIGAGGSAGSAPTLRSSSTYAPAPLAPQPQVQTTSLDQASLNQVGNATNRAYVLDSDVANNRERDTRLNRAARLG